MQFGQIVPFRKGGSQRKPSKALYKGMREVTMPAKTAKVTPYSELMERYIKGLPGVYLMKDYSEVFGYSYTYIDNWLRQGKTPSLEACAWMSINTRKYDLLRHVDESAYTFGEPGIPFREFLRVKAIPLATDSDVWEFLRYATSAATVSSERNRTKLFHWIVSQRDRFFRGELPTGSSDDIFETSNAG